MEVQAEISTCDHLASNQASGGELPPPKAWKRLPIIQGQDGVTETTTTFISCLTSSNETHKPFLTYVVFGIASSDNVHCNLSDYLGPWTRWHQLAESRPVETGTKTVAPQTGFSVQHQTESRVSVAVLLLHVIVVEPLHSSAQADNKDHC
ncbi:hypothetical protein Bbelb_053170 [Branchiostoma belcheri]|nr:hypothetical protein Bbelb_053170 [Branchiostoma belcheri]